MFSLVLDMWAGKLCGWPSEIWVEGSSWSHSMVRTNLWFSGLWAFPFPSVSSFSGVTLPASEGCVGGMGSSKSSLLPHTSGGGMGVSSQLPLSLSTPPPLSLFLISSGHLVGHIFGQTEFHSLRTLNLRPRGWAQKKQRIGKCLLQQQQFTLSGMGVLSDACFLLLQACPLVLYILLCSSHRLSFLFLSMPCDLRDLTSLTRDWTPGPWQWKVPSPGPLDC